MELMTQKNETYTVMPDIEEERGRLRNENMGMISDLNRFIKRKKRLVLKREYINYKYNEYGDSDRISELFKSWSAEYKNAKKEAETLKTEYEKKGGDEKTIPRVIKDIENDVAVLRKSILVARHEIDRVIETFPDLEGRAKDSEETASRYHAVHKDFVEKKALLTDLRQDFEIANKEKQGLEKRLSQKKEELDPLLKTENLLKDELTEITNRFNKQEELNEEKRGLEEVIGHLEKSVRERKEKIENHEAKTAEMNEEISNLKDESGKLKEKSKEYEAMVGPFKDLKERLENAEKEFSLVDEQHKKLAEETQKLKKENEILAVKARQYEELKKVMEGIK